MTRESFEALVRVWRERGCLWPNDEDFDDGVSAGYRICADQLQYALSAQQPVDAEPVGWLHEPSSHVYYRDRPEGCIPLYTHPVPKQQAVTDQVIRDAVNSFLCWRLPKDFHPDAGISFAPTHFQKGENADLHWPTGTNLFTAVQAQAMFEHCLTAALSAPVGNSDRPSDAAIAREFWKRWTRTDIHIEAAYELQRIRDAAALRGEGGGE